MAKKKKKKGKRSSQEAVSKKSEAGLGEKRASTKSLLQDLTKRLAGAKALRDGAIVVRARGAGGGDFLLESSKSNVRLSDSMPKLTVPPLIEIIGRNSAIQAILSGDADVTSQFLRGSFRVRGDLQYVSQLALEFGAIKRPL